MTHILSMPATKMVEPPISKLISPFYFESDVLRKAGLKWQVEIPFNFYMDWETILFFRGGSPVSGLIHDYLSRKNSSPVVSKLIAANVYYEMMCYRKTSFGFRNIKRSGVIVIPGYFHKKTVEWNPEL